MMTSIWIIGAGKNGFQLFGKPQPLSLTLTDLLAVHERRLRDLLKHNTLTLHQTGPSSALVTMMPMPPGGNPDKLFEKFELTL